MLGSVSPVSHTWVKTGLAILGASTLALGAALIGAPGAHAATHYITEDDVAPYEAGDEDDLSTYNYDQWHVGTTYDPAATLDESFVFGECSVTAVNTADYNTWPQMLKGYPIDERPNTIDEIRDVIESAILEVEDGRATLQFPIFVYLGDEEDAVEFSTIRTVPSDGSISVSGSTELQGTGWYDSGSSTFTLDELFEEMSYEAEKYGDKFELLGVGFNASAAESSEVSSISFGGDTYQFGNDCATEEEVTDPEEEVTDPEEEVTDPEEEEVVAPTPPEKVDTAFGSDALAITLMISGVAIAAAALSIRRSQTE